MRQNKDGLSLALGFSYRHIDRKANCQFKSVDEMFHLRIYGALNLEASIKLVLVRLLSDTLFLFPAKYCRTSDHLVTSTRLGKTINLRITSLASFKND